MIKIQPISLQCFSVCVLLIFASFMSFAKCQSDQILSNVASLPDCSETNDDSIYNFIYVSTLDGTVYALNAAENGHIAWQLKTDGEMLKSTIQNRELTNSGQWVRMIPSLSGSLYKFDGESIDLVPISVDQLLTSSFKYSDDLTFAGGKETLTYGISIPSGRILYRCSMQGCQNETSNEQNVEQDNDENSSVLIVQKKIQTVHAIAPESGIERWNFSVGQHDVKIHKKRQCHDQRKYHLNLDIRVVVPEGIVYAVEKSPLSREERVLWKQKLSSPIIDVWKWQSGQLLTIKIFNSDQWTWASTIPFNQKPSVYIGMHNKQLYIQESIVMQSFFGICNDKRIAAALPSIPWQPYLIASSTAVAFSPQIPAEETDHIDHDIANVAATSLAVLYSSKYINGNGFLLYSESNNDTFYSNSEKKKPYAGQCDRDFMPLLIEGEDHEIVDEINGEEETPVQIIIVSLWYWWKEVLIISITTAIVVNIVCTQRFFIGDNIKNGYKEKIIVVERPVPMVSNSSSESSTEQYPKNTAIESNNFMSRFITDFNLIHCLGKGGFGLVFEAQNKIDECNYAVKVINLPNRPDSRYRVMREVKALAKLEHTNIVRYFNAWLEFPPYNWSIYNEVPVLNDIHSNNTLFSSSVSQSLHENPVHLETPNDSFIIFNHSKSQASYTGIKIDDDSVQETDENSLSVEPNRSNTRMFLYIQMQLCRRESLKDWMLRNTNRTSSDVKEIFLQILSAVQYVHLQGLIHRDLKPSNIFFSMDGIIKVGDFGLCTDMADEQTISIPVDSNMSPVISNRKHTKEVGTQLYMSPEQLKGLAYNYKVDIYSLGVIFFELLIPFATEMERYKTLTDLRSNIYPKNFASRHVQEHVLLQLMLSYEPSERPTTSAIQDAILSK